MKAAIYARVSTGHQDPDNQLLKLREFAQAAGHQVTHEYIDQESGRSSGRAAFRQMMHDARRRRFDTLLFYSFSRLTREGPQRTALYLHELEQAGVSYISVSERARSQGKQIGRPRRVFNVDRARALEAQGHSLAAIARQLAVSTRTLRRRLNP